MVAKLKSIELSDSYVYKFYIGCIRMILVRRRQKLLEVMTQQIGAVKNAKSSDAPNFSSQHQNWQCMARKHPFEGNYGVSTN